jgi:hypothetical protein
MSSPRRLAAVVVAVMGLFLASASLAQQRQLQQQKKPEYATYVTAESAPKEYKLQGEYEGRHGNLVNGFQIIALGKDGMKAVSYGGGLPGKGWNGEDKVELKGVFEGEKRERVVFTRKESPDFKLVIEDGKATLTSQHGEQFELHKLERRSETIGAKPPAGAVVLFDGKNADAWNGGKVDERGLLMVACTSKQSFKDFTLHLEFMTPFMPDARGQSRGNSGVYLQNRYEIQVLDSFGLKGEDNECGGIYRVARPLVNMCLPPLAWQTYDIDFTSARFDGSGKKVKNAVVTVKHNGVAIHKDLQLPDKTGGGKPETAEGGPIHLQNHGNPVLFRNIWVVEKLEAAGAEWPMLRAMTNVP